MTHAVRLHARLRAITLSTAMLGVAACSPVRLLNATVPTGGLIITRDVAYGPLPRETLDIYRPVAGVTAQTPVVVFFYGGAWNSGSKAMYPFVAATLARTGAVVVVPDYRLYPQVIYPDFLRDCARAVAWAQNHRDRIGPGRLFLMGHSAGAYNAMMVGLDPQWLREAGADPGGIAGIVGLAGPYDFLPITDPEVKPIFPDAGPNTQPITYAGARNPPLLLLAGTDDGQVRPGNTTRMAVKVRASGGQAQDTYYKGVGHVGLVTAFAPAFQWRAPVLRDVTTFLRVHATMAGGTVANP